MVVMVIHNGFWKIVANGKALSTPSITSGFPRSIVPEKLTAPVPARIMQWSCQRVATMWRGDHEDGEDLTTDQ